MNFDLALAERIIVEGLSREKFPYIITRDFNVTFLLETRCKATITFHIDACETMGVDAPPVTFEIMNPNQTETLLILTLPFPTMDQVAMNYMTFLTALENHEKQIVEVEAKIARRIAAIEKLCDKHGLEIEDVLGRY
jgi:hypothetical protein